MQRAILAALAAVVCVQGGRAVAQESESEAVPEIGIVPDVTARVERAVPDVAVPEAPTIAAREPEVPVPPSDPALPARPVEAWLLHGFRLGYMYTFDIDSPLDSRRPDESSYAQQYDMRSPHSFLFGYEVAWRMVGHEWLNVLLIGNISIAGVEQSRFYPSGNLLFGFEVVQSGIGDIQVGIGASFTPTKDEPVHLVTAIGIAPLIGSFYLPLHVFFVPDVDGHHRVGLTVGANFY